MARKPTPQRAATLIANMMRDGEAASPQEAVNKRPDLRPGLAQFDESAPASRGSGPALLDRSL